MLERAARQTEGWASSPWEAASGQQRRRWTARRAPSVAALGWRGAAKYSSAVRLGARRPTITIPKELTEECLWGGSAPPNGLRLSCGRNTRGREELEPQTKKLASEATHFFRTCERPAASSAC